MNKKMSVKIVVPPTTYTVIGKVMVLSGVNFPQRRAVSQPSPRHDQRPLIGDSLGYPRDFTSSLVMTV